MTPETIPATSPSHLIEALMTWRDKYHRSYNSVMYYQRTGELAAPSPAMLQTWVDTFHTDVGGEVDDILDHESLFTGVRARYVNVAGVEVVAWSTGAPISGTQGDVIEDVGNELESLPPESALILRKMTGYSGRANRGRLFIPCVSETIQHDGILDDANATACIQICNELMQPADLDGTVMMPIHWNRKENIAVQIIQMGVVDFIRSRRDRRWKSAPFVRVTAGA